MKLRCEYVSQKRDRILRRDWRCVASGTQSTAQEGLIESNLGLARYMRMWPSATCTRQVVSYRTESAVP